MTCDPGITADPIQSSPLSASPKALLRKTLLATRRTLAAGARARWDAAIGAHIVAWWQVSQVATLGVYWPLRDEPDLCAAYAELAALGVQLALPVVLEKDKPLVFARWQPGEAMVKDKMGIAVPLQLRVEACPPAILVPCLGFNAQRFRLGYGGGFYDRTLAQTPRPVTLGIAYACLAAQFASDTHDIALDDIITEGGFI